ncbi:MAG: hypothetical protein QOF71_3281 [Candidatus Eremiobacteraeota bacterium]|jgi:hypothetical protein|nr:hypothetical protein [Candidatus Eremiobacteraeota bacterium]
MLTLHTPMLLALLGTALMAVVIFVPTRVATPATISFSPPASACAIARTPAWPTLIDRRAAGCDAAARLGLVEALASLRTPWSEAVLRGALDDEPDPAVRAAVVAALGVTLV